MATKLDVLSALNGETVPLTMSQIAEKMGVKPNAINTILKRMGDQGLVEKDESNCYMITPEGIHEVSPPTMESENLTPQKIFESYGRTIGINAAMLEAISDYVFKGGNYKDIKWVRNALGDMGIPADKLNIWWNKWRVYLGFPVPLDIEDVETPNSIEFVKKARERAEEKRAEETIEWDIGADDLPVNVGVVTGRMTHAEAMEIARYRVMAKARTAAGVAQTHSSEPIDPIDQLGRTMNLIKEHFSNNNNSNGTPKPLIVVPQEDGTMALQELDPSKPLILGGNRQPAAPVSSWVIMPDGSTKEVKFGEPVVIQAPAPAAVQKESVRTIIVHDSDGTSEEWKPGAPIILKPPVQQPVAPAAPPTTPMMINATLGGQQVAISLDQFFMLDDHQQKKKHEEENHQTKLDIATGIKDLIKKGAKALENMGTEDESEEEVV